MLTLELNGNLHLLDSNTARITNLHLHHNRLILTSFCTWPSILKHLFLFTGVNLQQMKSQNDVADVKQTALTAAGD